MTIKTAFPTALFALALAPNFGLADLTTAEADQVERLRGVQVLSSDGGLVGLIEGASISGDRAALFLRSTSGSFLPYRGKDIIISTNPSEISLQSGVVVLSSGQQRIRTKASRVKKDDDRIEVVLPRR